MQLRVRAQHDVGVGEPSHETVLRLFRGELRSVLFRTLSAPVALVHAQHQSALRDALLTLRLPLPQQRRRHDDERRARRDGCLFRFFQTRRRARVGRRRRGGFRLRLRRRRRLRRLGRVRAHQPEHLHGFAQAHLLAQHPAAPQGGLGEAQLAGEGEVPEPTLAFVFFFVFVFVFVFVARERVRRRFRRFPVVFFAAFRAFGVRPPALLPERPVEPARRALLVAHPAQRLQLEVQHPHAKPWRLRVRRAAPRHRRRQQTGEREIVRDAGGVDVRLERNRRLRRRRNDGVRYGRGRREMGHDELDLVARDELEHQAVRVHGERQRASTGERSRRVVVRSRVVFELRVASIVRQGTHRPYERDAPRGRVRVLRGRERRDQPRRVRLVEDDGAGVERFVEPVHRNQIAVVPGLALGVPGLQTVAVPVVVRHAAG